MVAFRDAGLPMPANRSGARHSGRSGLRCHSGDWNQEGDEFDIGVTAAASAARTLREAML